MEDWAKEPAHRIASAVARGEATAEEIVQSVLRRIDRHESVFRCYLHNPPHEELLEQAARIDRLRAAGKDLPLLAGVPVAVKDNIATLGMPTTCGSRILEGYHSPFDAEVVTRLRNAGAILMGKTNCDEFAMGSSTENSAFHVTRNPRNSQCVPGGSSGGSAAAVVAGEAAIALGSDTGGSIRQPAAFCGAVGLKPTYGTVSRYGLVAFASSFDQIGPMARNVADAALLYETISGHDPKDSTSRPERGECSYPIEKSDLGGLRIGVVRGIDEGLDEEVSSNVDLGIAMLVEAGARVVDVVLPSSVASIATYYVVATAEASSNLSRFDGVRFGKRDDAADTVGEMYMGSRLKGFGREVKRRILLGTYALSAGYYDAYYHRAMQVRKMIGLEYEEAFRSCDLIAGPTTPTAAFAVGEKTSDPIAMYLSDIYTTAANLTGLPAMSVPCGLTAGALPVGIQLTGPAMSEPSLFRAASAIERAAGALPVAPEGAGE